MNINKVFGVSNLSANTYLRDSNENEYTHSMPYYITLDTPDYYRNYQYIASDKIYSNHYDKSNIEQYSMTGDGENKTTVQASELFSIEKTFNFIINN